MAATRAAAPAVPQRLATTDATTDGVNAGLSQGFDQDALDRLTTEAGSYGTQTYTYDGSGGIPLSLLTPRSGTIMASPPSLTRSSRAPSFLPKPRNALS